MSKKGQGLSMNTIIIAAIALLVLVVLVAIFTGRIGSFSKGVDDVDDQSCVCVDGTHKCFASNAKATDKGAAKNRPAVCEVWLDCPDPKTCNAMP